MVNLLLDKTYNKKLISFFKEEGIFASDPIKKIVKENKRKSLYLSDILFHDTAFPEDKILKVLAKFFNVPDINLKNRSISREVINLIPKEKAEGKSFLQIHETQRQVH